MLRHRHLLHAIFLLFTALLLAFSAPAHAKADAAGVARLEALFTGLLDQYKDAAQTNGATLASEGKLLVEPNGDFYAVTLPYLKLKQADGSYTEIGMIAANVQPGDTPEQWKMTVAMPTPIVNYDDKGKPASNITLESQNFAGVWHEGFNSFIKANAQYRNIVLKNVTDSATVTLPDVKMVYDLKPGGEDLWSGPAEVVINKLRADAANGDTVRIDRLAFKSVVKDYSMQAGVDYQEKISALTESAKGGNANVSGQHALGLYNLVTGFMGSAWDGFDFTAEVKGFNLSKPGAPGVPPGSMKIADGTYGFAMNGFRNGKIAMKMKMAYDGFALDPLKPHLQRTVPDHFNLDFSINNLPYKEIIELGRNTIQTGVNAPQTGGLASLQAVLMLPQLLTQAQTNIAVNNGVAGNEHYNIALTSLFTANLAAAMGMTGTANAEIFGLDGLIESLNAAAGDPSVDAAQKEKIQKSLATLAIFKMVGQMSKDAQGRDVRTYKLEVNEQGQALLNGTDIQMIMQGMQGAQ